jgi:hypothetical protein
VLLIYGLFAGLRLLGNWNFWLWNSTNAYWFGHFFGVCKVALKKKISWNTIYGIWG